MVKAVDTLLGVDGDVAAILPDVVDSLECRVHCAVAQDKGQARIIRRDLVVAPGLWSWVYYPEPIEDEDEDEDEDEAEDEAEADGDRGGEERVAN